MVKVVEIVYLTTHKEARCYIKILTATIVKNGNKEIVKTDKTKPVRQLSYNKQSTNAKSNSDGFSRVGEDHNVPIIQRSSNGESS